MTEIREAIDGDYFPEYKKRKLQQWGGRAK
jgi:queuine tRNA-ribosyltransferase